MRTWGYYAFHSTINQIRKLFKTWVLVFILVCAVVGGAIGFGAAVLSDVADDGTEQTESVDEEYAEDEGEEETPGTKDEESEEPGMWQNILEQIPTGDMVELGVGLVILVLFLYMVISADKNGSKIFLPADVNLLFASPMKPQSVLLFRLMNQIGVIVISTIYLAFQIPNLMLNLGLSWGAVISIMLTWLFAIAIGQLLQVFCYTYFSTHVEKKPLLRKGIYLIAGIIVVGYIAYAKTSGLSYLAAAAHYFNNRVTRWIPLWGWLKGLSMYAVEGNIIGTVLSGICCLASTIFLILMIWRIKADFYEDAMAKSEQTARLQEIRNGELKTGFVKRKKDRSDKVKRDGMNHGAGANVFFYRILYNRIRFGHLGFFTKTTETYLAVTVGIIAVSKFAIHGDGFMMVMLMLGGMAFFRSLGNPLAEDTSKDFFWMIPEDTGVKLFWSVLGGTVNCMLDLLPALILATVIFLKNPLLTIAWMIFILSVDFYGTCVGTFIDLSLPESISKIVKQLFQIAFVYFGLIPDIAIMAVGIVTERVGIAAMGASTLNLALGLLFLGLTPLLVDHKEIPAVGKNSFTKAEKKTAKKAFSRIGLACTAILVVSSIMQIVAGKLLAGAADTVWGIWIMTFMPIYVIGVPAGLLIFKKVPKIGIPQKKFGIGKVIKSVFISFFMMMAGNLIGNLVTGFINLLTGNQTQAAIVSYAMDDSILFKVLFLVILAPIIEEYIFRKQIIDRIRIYGERRAVFVSGLLFGLFHANLSQFFYAMLLGFVFGYVYIRTGKLRYSAGLHMLINLFGSVISVEVINRTNLESLARLEHCRTASDVFRLLTSSGVVGYGIYMLVIILAAIAGLVLLILSAGRLEFRPAPRELPRKGRRKITYLNPGMLVFIVGTILLMIFAQM